MFLASYLGLPNIAGGGQTSYNIASFSPAQIESRCGADAPTEKGNYLVRHNDPVSEELPESSNWPHTWRSP